jgi:RNA polymerase sigma factor (sigma-70 family)
VLGGDGRNTGDPGVAENPQRGFHGLFDDTVRPNVSVQEDEVTTSQSDALSRRTVEGPATGRRFRMINECEPRYGRLDAGVSPVTRERSQLINVAYRLLGSVAEAEDAVQETYARWHAMTREQQQAIEAPGAWLTKVASRICLDVLGSARVRRERYTGEWLPEPLPEPAEWAGERRNASTVDPADRITLDESINMAFLVVLDAMSPAERVAFILHDVFRYSFAEVAEIAAGALRRVVNWHQRAAAASVRRVLRGPSQPGRPASSGTSSGHGKRKTSTPCLVSLTPTPSQLPTAAASRAPTRTRSKAANGSRAPTLLSPAPHPTGRSWSAPSTAGPAWSPNWTASR